MPSPKQAAQPNPRHHISMEHRLRRKQLNSDTDACNKTYKRKKGKEGPKRYLPRRLEKILVLSNVARNLEAIEAQNRISSNPEKKRKKKNKKK